MDTPVCFCFCFCFFHYFIQCRYKWKTSNIRLGYLDSWGKGNVNWFNIHSYMLYKKVDYSRSSKIQNFALFNSYFLFIFIILCIFYVFEFKVLMPHVRIHNVTGLENERKSSTFTRISLRSHCLISIFEKYYTQLIFSRQGLCACVFVVMQTVMTCIY